MPAPCECVDVGCPVHKGKPCHSYRAETILYRTDMVDDVSGTHMCEKCADDALDSGLFRTEDHNLYQSEVD